jgi:hypothetical protein
LTGCNEDKSHTLAQCKLEALNNKISDKDYSQYLVLCMETKGFDLYLNINGNKSPSCIPSKDLDGSTAYNQECYKSSGFGISL